MQKQMILFSLYNDKHLQTLHDMLLVNDFVHILDGCYICVHTDIVKCCVSLQRIIKESGLDSSDFIDIDLLRVSEISSLKPLIDVVKK